MPLAGGTEPYVLKMWQERLSQVQGSGARYLEVFFLEQLHEPREAHAEQMIQLLHRVLMWAVYSFVLCARQGCAVKP